MIFYKGFEITVEKEKTITGEKSYFYSIFRQTDKWELAGDISELNKRDTVTDCKLIVDDYLKNPQDYED